MKNNLAIDVTDKDSFAINLPNVTIYFNTFLLSAYQTTYGEDPVWKHYRRNYKGQFPPRKTRKRCIVSYIQE